MMRSFEVPEQFALKLEALAKRENKNPQELLALIVREYIEVQEFLERKLNQKAAKRKPPRSGPR